MINDDDKPSSGVWQQEVVDTIRVDLENKVRSGANWFYWIAVLSIINSIILIVGGEWSFVVGLGITQAVSGFAYVIIEETPDLRGIVLTVAVLANLAIVASCAAFGFRARTRNPRVLVFGMTLYGLDGLLCLAFSDYLGFGFHLLVLWFMFGGVRALQALHEGAEGNAPQSVSPG